MKDPDKMLASLEALTNDMQGWRDLGEDPDEPGEYYRIADEMTEGFAALNAMLRRGGFPPAAWSSATERERRALELEHRCYRLRSALLEAGVPENLVRAVELGGEV